MAWCNKSTIVNMKNNPTIVIMSRVGCIIMTKESYIESSLRLVVSLVIIVLKTICMANYIPGISTYTTMQPRNKPYQATQASFTSLFGGNNELQT